MMRCKTHAFTSWNPCFHLLKCSISQGETHGFAKRNQQFQFFDTTIKIFIFTTHYHTLRYKHSTPNARIFAYLRTHNFYFQTWPFYSITILTIKEGLSLHLLNNVKTHEILFFALQKNERKNKKK